MCNLRNSFNLFENLSDNNLKAKGRCNRGRMVVGFITTYVISAYHHYRCECESSSGEVYSIQHYVIKFVSDLQQVGGFRRVHWFPPPIKLTATMQLKYF